MLETINGYTLNEPLKTDNSGFSKWGFGTLDGKEYFIKEFLSPVYPIDVELLGQELTTKKRNICKAYVAEQKKIYERINAASDGNLLRIDEFFRYGSKYYIVMEKIESVEEAELKRLPKERKILLCMILAHALSGMHEAGLVHSDMKLDNVIFYKNPAGYVGAKIIDIDSAFLEEKPPKNEDELTGDQIYMAPETFLFIAEEEGHLTHKIDVFALGLMFHQIFADGELPGFDHGKWNYIYEVVLDEGELQFSSKLPVEIRGIVAAMLKCTPMERPELRDVYDLLRNLLNPKEIISEKKTDAVKNETPLKKTEEKIKEYTEDFFFRAGEDDL
ncbi:MAG: protein kinase [Eubacteriales bacterium]|nr:protein kinase [Eubacteriales bacterium]